MFTDETPRDRAIIPDVDLDPQHDEHRIAQMMVVWRYTPEAARYELDTRRHRPWRGYSFDASGRIVTVAETAGRGVPNAEAAGDWR